MEDTGSLLSCTESAREGSIDGNIEGCSEGLEDGSLLGCAEGAREGSLDDKPKSNSICMWVTICLDC